MPSGWHRADIIAAVRKKGTSLRALSLKTGRAESTLRAALLKPARPSNLIISEFLGVPLYVLWPQWFDRQGRLRPGINSAKARAAESTQKKRAA